MILQTYLTIGFTNFMRIVNQVHYINNQFNLSLNVHITKILA